MNSPTVKGILLAIVLIAFATTLIIVDRMLIYLFAVPAILFAAGISFRKKMLLWWPFLAVIALSITLGLTGIEVYFVHEGRYGISVLPIVWGLPTRDALILMEQRKLFGGGCILPRCPAQTALVITY